MTGRALSAPRIFLVAGEPSGDTLGTGLLRALKVKAPVLQPMMAMMAQTTTSTNAMMEKMRAVLAAL